MKLTEDSVCKISPHCIYRPFEDEYIVVHTRRGKVIRVNRHGGKILEKLNGIKSLGDIAGEIRDEEKIPYQEALEGIIEFLIEMAGLEVIIPA